ncbi:hypothetical protein KM043_013510 [Ampulex compressa]|nr:hypothetical protein KM043_013510 [Ampulex compressa]
MYVFEELKGGKTFYRTLGSLNLGAICIGITLGWPDPELFQLVIPSLYCKEMPYDNTILESLTNFGASIGAVVPLCLVDTLGRRISFATSGAVCTASWLTLILVNSSVIERLVEQCWIFGIIACAAVAGGLATGIFLTTVSLYVAEISSSANRGTVGALVTFCIYIGVLIINCLAIVPYFWILLYVMCVVSAIFLVSTTVWMVESPHFLYQRGKVLDAKLCLKALRGTERVLQIQEEFKSMERFFNAGLNVVTKPTLYQVFHPKNTKRSIAVILPILCISQMIGGYAMDDYAEEVINIVVPHYGKILLATLDVLSVGICLYMIEKVGRKPLLMLSVFASAICCFALGIYRYVGQLQCQTVKGHMALPVGLISVYYAVYCLGLTPILPILTGEIFPCRVKTVAVSCCMMIVYLFAVIMQRLYVLLIHKAGSCLAFAIFALLGSAGIPLALASVPETKGKSLYQIQGELAYVGVIIS